MSEFTTMEHLSMDANPTYGSVLKYGNHVLAADMNWKGEYHADIYEFVETAEETGLGFIECRLQKIASSDQPFEDSGHAIAWALAYLATK